MPFSRRHFFSLAATPLVARLTLPARKPMSSRERVDRAMEGRDVDRTPFSFWHHFLLEKEPPERLARAAPFIAAAEVRPARIICPRAG